MTDDGQPAAAPDPWPGRIYADALGRTLTVDGVAPGDRLGREVVGWVEWTEDPEIALMHSARTGEARPDWGTARRRDRYSTTLRDFAATWRPA